MAVASETLDRGRAAFERRAWEDAFAQLTEAQRQGGLGPDDLDRLAMAAYLTGRDEPAVSAWERAHQVVHDADDAPRAARCAFWIAFALLHRGEAARAGGWLTRAQRLLDEAGAECVEQGYLLFPAALQRIMGGEVEAAYRLFGQAAEVGERFGDGDLTILARHGQGRALVRLGQTAEGVSLLDEAMVAVTADEVSPMIAGDVYCSVIEACQELFDVRRAQEWTQALSDWCATQPDLVPYRGQCLVHRSELLQLHGHWPDAMEEVERARRRLSDPPGQPALGMAHYQQAELHRLRGAFDRAEAAYQLASRHGRQPQPGLGLLRLAQGRTDAAEAAIRHVLDEAEDRTSRARLLAGYVEIMLAAGDLPAARAGADELVGLAADLDAPLLTAMSDHASGAVLLDEEEPVAARRRLRGSWTAWCDLGVPYEAARVQVRLGLACRALGDHDTARLELDAARRAFVELGATPDVGRVEALTRRTPAHAPGGLTPREIEVLGLVATGRTNRGIADELVISEKTVARHLSNIFTKLGVSSRSAATAYAYEHDLV